MEEANSGVVGMDLFLRITLHRMTDHYLIKLVRAIRAMDQEQLWRHPSQALNSTGGIVLHIVEHVRRSAETYRATALPAHGQGIEEHFPNAGFSPDELAATVESTFREWSEVMSRVTASECQADDMHRLFHLVEHTGYHLGQIIDRTRTMTAVSFQFCQTGLNVRSLREFIDRRPSSGGR